MAEETSAETETMDEIRISGDSHVAEPPDLWQKNMPTKFKDRALSFPNVQLGKHNYARTGGWDPKARLIDQAYDGISAEVIFPTSAKGLYEQFFDQPVDLDLYKAGERVYNDWMIEFCSEDPDRLWGQAFIGLWDIDYAINEAQRVKEAGLKGLTTWVAPPDDLPWTGDHYERFWSAAEELQLPISMHINSGFGPYVTRSGEAKIDVVSRQAFGHKVVAMRTMAEMILSGVFERHPRLKVLLAEYEVGWIPFFLEDMDRKIGRSLGSLGLSKLPSEYFSASVCATFMQDATGAFLLQQWGEDNFVYSNDYPHAGGVWPYTDDTVALTLQKLPAETRRKVLGENLAKLFGQPMPKPVVRAPISDYNDDIWSRPWLKKAGDYTFDKKKMGLAV